MPPTRIPALAALLALIACGGGEQRPAPASAGSSDGSVSGRPRLVVGVDREFPPYSYVGDDDRIAGKEAVNYAHR